MKRLRSAIERARGAQAMTPGSGGGRTPLVGPTPAPMAEVKTLGSGGLPSAWTVTEPDTINGDSVTETLGFTGYIVVTDQASAATCTVDPTGDAPFMTARASSGAYAQMGSTGTNAVFHMNSTTSDYTVQIGRLIDASEFGTGVMPPVAAVSLCIDGAGNAVLQLHSNDDGSQNQLAFFGHGIVGQQAAPGGTLAEVITALKNYGLLAP